MIPKMEQLREEPREYGESSNYRQQRWGEGNSVCVKLISDFSFVILYEVWNAVAFTSVNPWFTDDSLSRGREIGILLSSESMEAQQKTSALPVFILKIVMTEFPKPIDPEIIPIPQTSYLFIYFLKSRKNKNKKREK